MKLKETIEQFPQTEIWNDSCDLNELEYAVNYGASGATTNPVIVQSVVSQNLDKYEGLIKQLITENPTDTEDDIVWKLIGKLGQDASPLLIPEFEKSKGLRGRISYQVNAKFYNNPNKMVENGVELNNLIENGQIKIPASKAGIEACEELTYRGISINATVCYTVSQAVAIAEAVERGLNRRSKEGLSNEHMSPVCTIMAGRVDDYIKKVVNDNKLIVDPEILEYAGVAVGKKVYKIYKEKGFKTRLLIAAYRNHYHWSEFIGGDLVLTIPYGWQKRFNESDVEIKDRINIDIKKEYLEKLQKLEEFNKAYDETGLSEEEFAHYGAFQVTIKQFLGGYDELVKIIRNYYVG